MASPWTVDEIPSDLSGKTVLITGATAGIGFEAARVFASRKCNLILACRTPDKMTAVAATFKEDGAAKVDEFVCDLSDLESVRACASNVLASSPTIDVLLLNAGRGHGNVEICMTSNHLGHFLLTGLIFSSLAPDARIISVSSIAHDISKPIPWDKISADNNDSESYGYSKLANLLFVEELNRLLVLKASSIIATGAHPGCTQSEFITKMDVPGFVKRILSYAMSFLAQPTAHGAWPMLMAATDPEITRDSYYGPGKDSWIIKEWSGPPIRNARKGKALADKAAAETCWKESERITKFDFKI